MLQVGLVHALGRTLIRIGAARCGRAAVALLLCLLAALAAAGGARAQIPPAASPPGNGGVTFGSVRVTAGNDLPRNAGQENQPPVWITLDAKGSSAVVTVGNATKVALDFHGTVVLNLAPDVQATQVLVSTGTAVIQGNQVIWNGFSLASGQIEPSIVQLAPAGGGTPATVPASAISSVNIEAKDGQSGTAVTELVAGGGPAIAALRPAPSGVAANRPGGAAPAGAPLTQNAARTFGIVALALLVCTLLALALVATLVVSTARRLEQRLALAKAPAGAGLSEAPRAATRSEPAGESQATPPRARLVLQGGSQGGREWLLDGTEVGIGRSPRNQVVLADPRVSDRHAQVLRRDGDGYLLADSSSTNGTFLNGERIDAPTALHDGDELRLGTTTLTFHSG